jgi:hypothetical protein
VAAELCRRGLIATTFTGNVPDFDIIAINEAFETIPIQVKTIWHGYWQLDADNFLIINKHNDIQEVIGKESLSNSDLIYIFVRLISQGDDEFYILQLRDLQEIIFDDYSQYLAKYNGKRPKNPNSTHIGMDTKLLQKFRDNWDLITNQL